MTSNEVADELQQPRKGRAHGASLLVEAARPLEAEKKYSPMPKSKLTLKLFDYGETASHACSDTKFRLLALEKSLLTHATRKRDQ